SVFVVPSILTLHKWTRRGTRCCRSFLYQTDLYCLQAVAASFGTGACTVLCPSEPAILLRMNAVINVKVLCHISCQANLNRFQAKTFSRCSAYSAILFPG